MTVHGSVTEPWRVTLVDTGDDTGTGGRLRRIQKYLAGPTILLHDLRRRPRQRETYRPPIAFHKSHGKLVTLTSVQPVARFGASRPKGHPRLRLSGEAKRRGGWINGGFFVLSPKVIAEVKDSHWMLKHKPLRRWSPAARCQTYPHHGFWQAMDTLRDKQQLEELWALGRAPWKSW